MSQTTKVLVTGASRGLGQAFVDNLALQPHTHVYAGMRNAGDTGAQSNGSVQILALDVSSNESVRDAAAKVEELDILILNAGMGAPARLSETSPEELTQYLEANSIGVHRVIQAFLPALRKGREKKIILIASQSGSFARQVHSNSIGFGGPYAVSKAAGIMVAVQYHRELNTFNNEGFTVVPTHPGWVDTAMGQKVLTGDGTGATKGMDAKECATKILELIYGFSSADSGVFVDRDGQIVPW